MADVQKDHLRAKIIERAHNDIVASGAYTYRSFVRWVLELTLPRNQALYPENIKDRVVYVGSRIVEAYQWIGLSILSALLRVMRRFLPSRIESFLRKIFT